MSSIQSYQNDSDSLLRVLEGLQTIPEDRNLDTAASGVASEMLESSISLIKAETNLDPRHSQDLSLMKEARKGAAAWNSLQIVSEIWEGCVETNLYSDYFETLKQRAYQGYGNPLMKAVTAAQETDSEVVKQHSHLDRNRETTPAIDACLKPKAGWCSRFQKTMDPIVCELRTNGEKKKKMSILLTAINAPQRVTRSSAMHQKKITKISVKKEPRRRMRLRSHARYALRSL